MNKIYWSLLYNFQWNNLAALIKPIQKRRNECLHKLFWCIFCAAAIAIAITRLPEHFALLLSSDRKALWVFSYIACEYVRSTSISHIKSHFYTQFFAMEIKPSKLYAIPSSAMHLVCGWAHAAVVWLCSSVKPTLDKPTRMTFDFKLGESAYLFRMGFIFKFALQIRLPCLTHGPKFNIFFMRNTLRLIPATAAFYWFHI